MPPRVPPVAGGWIVGEQAYDDFSAVLRHARTKPEKEWQQCCMGLLAMLANEMGVQIELQPGLRMEKPNGN